MLQIKRIENLEGVKNKRMDMFSKGSRYYQITVLLIIHLSVIPHSRSFTSYVTFFILNHDIRYNHFPIFSQQPCPIVGGIRLLYYVSILNLSSIVIGQVEIVLYLNDCTIKTHHY